MAILAMIVIGIAIAGMFLYLAETIWNDFVDEVKTVLVSDAGAVFLCVIMLKNFKYWGEYV